MVLEAQPRMAAVPGVIQALEARVVVLAMEERRVLVAQQEPLVKVATEARQEQVVRAAQVESREPEELEAVEAQAV
jgi:hypothetical protein